MVCIYPFQERNSNSRTIESKIRNLELKEHCWGSDLTPKVNDPYRHNPSYKRISRRNGIRQGIKTLYSMLSNHNFQVKTHFQTQSSCIPELIVRHKIIQHS